MDYRADSERRQSLRCGVEKCSRLEDGSRLPSQKRRLSSLVGSAGRAELSVGDSCDHHRLVY